MPDFLKSDSQIEKYSEILILKLLNLVEHLSDTQDNFQRDKQQMLNSESNLHFFFLRSLASMLFTIQSHFQPILSKIPIK